MRKAGTFTAISPLPNSNSLHKSTARLQGFQLLSHASIHTSNLLSFHPVKSIKKEMDTSNPAVLVNAELLRMHVGRRVRAVIQVMRSDGGGSVIGKSTDDQQLVIKGHPPAPLSTFVEVIGISDSNQSIVAEIWTNFGDSFDMACYNNVCQLANGDFKHMFI